MKVPLLPLFSTLLLSVSSVQAGGVTLTTAGGKCFTKKSGDLLAQGSIIRLGTFDLPPSTRDATLRATGDYAKLKSWFRPLAESIQGAGAASQGMVDGPRLRVNGFPSEGDVFGVVSNIQVGYMAPGAKLYVWIFDGSAPESSTEWGIFTAENWRAPQKLGMVALSTTTQIEVIQGGETTEQLRLAVPQMTYGNWCMRKFATENPPADALFSADPDGDGLNNLAEYAWQLDPKTKNDVLSHLTASAGSGGQTSFQFKAPRALPDVQVVAESSPDLRIWTPSTTVITDSDDAFDTHTTRAPVGATQLFWRVRFVAVTAP